MAERKQMNVRLPSGLIEEIDDRRAVTGLTRDETVEGMLRAALRSAGAPRAITTAPGRRTVAQPRPAEATSLAAALGGATTEELARELASRRQEKP